MADYDKISTLITTVGFPISLVLGFAFATWRAMVWFAPHATRIVESHVNFLSSIQLSVHSLKESGEKTIQAVQTLTDKMAERDEKTEKLLETIATRPCLLPECKRHSASMPEGKQ